MSFSFVQAAALEDFSPVSHYDCDEASGVRVDSNTTNSNDLSDINTVASGSGQSGNACDFEKTDNDYLEITDANQTGLDITGDISIGIWCNFESTPTAAEQYWLVNKWGTSPQTSYAWYYWDNGGTPTITLTVDEGATNHHHNEAYTFTTGTWYLISTSLDVSATTNKIYVNGTQIGSTDSGHASAIYDSSAPFRLSHNSNSVDGLCEDAMVFNTVISDADWTTIYNSGTPLSYFEATSTATSTATTTAEFNDRNIVFMLGVIIFFLAFFWFGVIISSVRK